MGSEVGRRTDLILRELALAPTAMEAPDGVSPIFFVFMSALEICSDAQLLGLTGCGFRKKRRYCIISLFVIGLPPAWSTIFSASCIVNEVPSV